MVSAFGMIASGIGFPFDLIVAVSRKRHRPSFNPLLISSLRNTLCKSETERVMRRTRRESNRSGLFHCTPDDAVSASPLSPVTPHDGLGFSIAPASLIDMQPRKLNAEANRVTPMPPSRIPTSLFLERIVDSITET